MSTATILMVGIGDFGLGLRLVLRVAVFENLKAPSMHY